MNESMTHSRIYRFLRIILNIGFWVCLIFSAIYLMVFILNPNIISMASLAFDGFSLSFENTSMESSFRLTYISLLSVTMITGILCIYILRSIVNSLQSSSPFSYKNVKRIRIIGFLVLLQAYFKQFLCYLLAGSMTQNAQNGLLSVIQPRFNLVPEGAFLAICIFIIAEIFRFGCVLQHEHDTTV